MNRKIGLKALMVIAFGIIAASAYSQEEPIEHHHHHHQQRYELGVANALAYFAGEKEFAYGLHIHLLRNIPHSRFGFGLAYERIFDEHGHNTIGVVGSYNPFKSWYVNLAPGIAFEDDEPSVLKFAFHAETLYDLDVGPFHLGPLIGFSIDPEDHHFSLGFHMGFGF